MLHHWTHPLVTPLAHSPDLETGAISPIISPCGPVYVIHASYMVTSCRSYMVILCDLPDDLHQRLVPFFMVQMVGNILISHRHIKNIYLTSQFEACQAATFIHNMYDSYTRSMTVAVKLCIAIGTLCSGRCGIDAGPAMRIATRKVGGHGSIPAPNHVIRRLCVIAWVC